MTLKVKKQAYLFFLTTLFAKGSEGSFSTIGLWNSLQEPTRKEAIYYSEGHYEPLLC